MGSARPSASATTHKHRNAGRTSRLLPGDQNVEAGPRRFRKCSRCPAADMMKNVSKRLTSTQRQHLLDGTWWQIDDEVNSDARRMSFKRPGGCQTQCRDSSH